MLFPSQADILETEVTTATRVAEFMFEKGLAQVERPRDIRAGSRVSSTRHTIDRWSERVVAGRANSRRA